MVEPTLLIIFKCSKPIGCQPTTSPFLDLSPPWFGCFRYDHLSSRSNTIACGIPCPGTKIENFGKRTFIHGKFKLCWLPVPVPNRLWIFYDLWKFPMRSQIQSPIFLIPHLLLFHRLKRSSHFHLSYQCPQLRIGLSGRESRSVGLVPIFLFLLIGKPMVSQYLHRRHLRYHPRPDPQSD